MPEIKTESYKTKFDVDPKEQALPTIDIQGKPYVQVKDRILRFNELYKNGTIKTEIVSYENGQVIMKATVYPNSDNASRFFNAYSQEKEGSNYINKTSALENAETSAVGRALAMMGIGVIESVASADEVTKAVNHQAEPEETREAVDEQQRELGGPDFCVIHQTQMKAMTGQYGKWYTHSVSKRVADNGMYYLNCNGKTQKENFVAA